MKTDFAQTNITIMQKLTKYIIMGLIVITAAKYIPDAVLSTKEVIMIGATSSIAFAILDMVSPSVNIVSTPITDNKVIVETH